MQAIAALFSPHAMVVVHALEGHTTRAMGGAVRAWLGGQAMKGTELDLFTTATPEQMAFAFGRAAIPYDTSHARYGTVVAWPNDDEKRLEITTLRTESYIPGSRYPSVVFTTDWQADALRRDFTFNAVSVSPLAEVYDLFDGQAHLTENRVVFVGEPLKRLSEDPLRLLRFFRFCGTYGLAGLTPEVAEALHAAAEGLPSISRKKMAAEVAKIRASVHAAKVINAMKHKGIWQHLPSELTEVEI